MDKFTVEQVQEMLPGFIVEEARGGRGVRVAHSTDLTDNDKTYALEPMPRLLRAALALKLHPDQLEDNSTYSDDRRMGSSWTGEYGSEFIHYDVTFLYEVPSREGACK